MLSKINWVILAYYKKKKKKKILVQKIYRLIKQKFEVVDKKNLKNFEKHYQKYNNNFLNEINNKKVIFI